MVAAQVAQELANVVSRDLLLEAAAPATDDDVHHRVALWPIHAAHARHENLEHDEAELERRKVRAHQQDAVPRGKRAFEVLASCDLHVIEPRTLWEDYLDPKFRGRIVTVPGDYGSVRAHVDGKVLPPYADRPERQRAWSFRYRRPGAERLHRGTLPKEALEAMDIEAAGCGAVALAGLFAVARVSRIALPSMSMLPLNFAPSARMTLGARTSPCIEPVAGE